MASSIRDKKKVEKKTLLDPLPPSHADVIYDSFLRKIAPSKGIIKNNTQKETTSDFFFYGGIYLMRYGGI